MSSIAVMQASMQFQPIGDKGRQCQDCGNRQEAAGGGLRCTRGAFYVKPFNTCAEFKSTPGPVTAIGATDV